MPRTNRGSRAASRSVVAVSSAHRPGVRRAGGVGAQADHEADAELGGQSDDVVAERLPPVVRLRPHQQQDVVAVAVGGGEQLDRAAR